MSDVDTLRRAAEQIRNDHGGPISRHTRDGLRWLPVADWLTWCAERDAFNSRALRVARAYLAGEAS